MSFQAMTWAVEQKVGSQSAKFLLLILANYADNSGMCWPSQERLASDTEMTDRGIRKCLALLVEKGLVSFEERRGTGGVRKTNIYRLSLPERGSSCEADYRNVVPPATGTTFLQQPERGSSKPISSNQSEEPVRHISSHDALFARILDALPKRPGDSRANAEKALKTALKRGDDPEAIFRAADLYARSRQGQDPQYHKGRAAWINARPWADPEYNPIVEHSNVGKVSGRTDARGDFRAALARFRGKEQERTREADRDTIEATYVVVGGR